MLLLDQKKEIMIFPEQMTIGNTALVIKEKDTIAIYVNKEVSLREMLVPMWQKTNESNISISRVLSQNIVLRDWTNKH